MSDHGGGERRTTSAAHKADPAPATDGAGEGASEGGGGRPAEGSGERPAEGDGVVRFDLAGTAVFVVAAAAGVVDPDVLAYGTAVVSGAMFVIGCVTFLWAFGIAVGRSRTEAVGLGGIYFLAGQPGGPAQSRLRLALAVQVVVALVAGIARLYTPVAFVALAPMFGLGLLGLWGARHAVFPPRDAP
jgi:hypothetical protein